MILHGRISESQKRGAFRGTPLRSAAALSITVLMMSTGVVRSSAAEASSCFGKRPTITGTKNGDELRGTKRDDVIVSRGGPDLIFGLGGDDRICAGGGHDRIRTGSGFDRVTGAGGHDDIWGAEGQDSINGGSGNDFLSAGSSLDFLAPGSGDDVVVGGNTDVVDLTGAPRGLRVDLARGRASGWGRDRIVGIGGILGSRHADVLLGGDGSTFLVGNGGNDSLAGRRGKDILYGSGGNDEIGGGPGRDLVAFAASPQSVEANLLSGRATGEGSDRLTAVEAVFGSIHDDTLLGDAGNNVLVGAEGNDVMRGDVGNDVLYGLDGAGTETIDGGPGRDLAVLVAGPVTADLEQGTAGSPLGGAATLSGIEDLMGTWEDDLLQGDAKSNRIEGSAGSDRVLGRAGDDRVYGDSGADVLDGGDGDDLVDGGRGSDVCTTGERERGCEIAQLESLREAPLIDQAEPSCLHECLSTRRRAQPFVDLLQSPVRLTFRQIRSMRQFLNR